MAQVRGNFAELYDNVDKRLTALMMSELEELKAIWRQYFNVETSDRKFERRMTVTPFGDVPEKPEGEIYAMDLIRAGWTKDFTHVEFGLGFEVTETALEDDQFSQLMKSATWLAFSARVVEEKRAAVVFNAGFSTELAPDGLSLFNTAHVLKGGGTASNRLTVAADLSTQSLTDLLSQVQTETKIESGQLVSPIMSYNLLCHPSIEFLAHRIVESDKLPGSADNDTNAIKDLRSINVIANPYFTDTDAWFLVPRNKRQHGLLSFTRMPITKVPKAIDPFTGNLIFKVRFRRSWGAEFWQGVAASEGA